MDKLALVDAAEPALDYFTIETAAGWLKTLCKIPWRILPVNQYQFDGVKADIDTLASALTATNLLVNKLNRFSAKIINWTYTLSVLMFFAFIAIIWLGVKIYKQRAWTSEYVTIVLGGVLEEIKRRFARKEDVKRIEKLTRSVAKSAKADYADCDERIHRLAQEKASQATTDKLEARLQKSEEANAKRGEPRFVMPSAPEDIIELGRRLVPGMMSVIGKNDQEKETEATHPRPSMSSAFSASNNNDSGSPTDDFMKEGEQCPQIDDVPDALESSNASVSHIEQDAEQQQQPGNLLFGHRPDQLDPMFAVEEPDTRVNASVPPPEPSIAEQSTTPPAPYSESSDPDRSTSHGPGADTLSSSSLSQGHGATSLDASRYAGDDVQQRPRPRGGRRHRNPNNGAALGSFADHTISHGQQPGALSTPTDSHAAREHYERRPNQRWRTENGPEQKRRFDNWFNKHGRGSGGNRGGRDGYGQQ